MALLDKLKSLLGMDESRSRSQTRSGDGERGGVRVEREPEGNSTRGSGGETTDERSRDDSRPSDDATAVADTDASASTGSMTDEDGSPGAAEPSEAAGPGSETTETNVEGESDTEGSDADFDTGTDDASDEASSVDTVGGDEEADEAAAAGADASASTGSMTEESAANESISAAEPAEATGPTENPPTDDAEDQSVDVLKGIGPSYSATLADAGVDTVSDLATADVETLSTESGVSEKRLERWVEHAKARRQ